MRLCTAVLLAAFTAATPSMTSFAQDRTPVTLTALRGNARPLLIFGDTDDARVLQQYGEVAEHAEAAKERDIKVVLFYNTTVLRDAPGAPEAFFSREEQASAMRRFHVAPGDFAVVLVGKDGGEKLRSSHPILWQKLASTIDAMPMRRDEMKQK